MLKTADRMTADFPRKILANLEQSYPGKPVTFERCRDYRNTTRVRELDRQRSLTNTPQKELHSFAQIDNK